MRNLLTLFLLSVSFAIAQIAVFPVSANKQPNTRTNLIAVPTSITTVVNGKQVDVFQIVVANVSSGSLWFTAQCNDGTAFIYQAVIGANTTQTLLLGTTGLACTSGFSVQAQSSGLNFQAFWRQ